MKNLTQNEFTHEIIENQQLNGTIPSEFGNLDVLELIDLCEYKTCYQN